LVVIGDQNTRRWSLFSHTKPPGVCVRRTNAVLEKSAMTASDISTFRSRVFYFNSGAIVVKLGYTPGLCIVSILHQ
jgi:hypothetical protein